MELSTTTTLEAVKAVLVDALGIEDRAVALDADSPLFGSLPELDSLGVAEVVVALEQRFDVEFDERRRERRRVRDARQPRCGCRGQARLTHEPRRPRDGEARQPAFKAFVQ